MSRVTSYDQAPGHGLVQWFRVKACRNVQLIKQATSLKACTFCWLELPCALLDYPPGLCLHVLAWAVP